MKSSDLALRFGLQRQCNPVGVSFVLHFPFVLLEDDGFEGLLERLLVVLFASVDVAELVEADFKVFVEELEDESLDELGLEDVPKGDPVEELQQGV